MEIEYKETPDVDEQELQDELSESPEFFPTDSFNEDSNDDLFFNDDKEQEQTTAPLDLEAVNIFVNSFTTMISSFLGVMTGKDSKRYLPQLEQRKTLSKAIVKAFPMAKVSPFMGLIIAIVMAYAPITVMLVSDIKDKKNNENGSIDNSSGD